MAKQAPIHQMTIRQFEAMFPDDDACRAFLQANRWPSEMYCPRCGVVGPRALPSRPWHWICEACATGSNYRFSLFVGTIFENTKYPLREWFRVIHMMLTSKKGISALQVHRTIGTGSYRTAWYMCHRIRVALQDVEFHQLMGIVEVDETFVGGKDRNRHWDKRSGGSGGTGSGKTPIAGAVSRKGNVVARVIERVNAETMTAFVRDTVSERVSLLCTDDSRVYNRVNALYPHGMVNHSAREYVVGAIHTNTIEGFWSIFKRGVVGTFHRVSTKYMALYVAEFCFRYNNRANADIFGTAVRAC